MYLDYAQGLVAPAVVKLVPVEEIGERAAKLRVGSLDLVGSRILHVQQMKRFADGVEQGDAVGDGQAPAAPGNNERGLEESKHQNMCAKHSNVRRNLKRP